MHVLCSTLCHYCLLLFVILFTVMQLYVCSVQYVVSLLFAAICNLLITRIMIFNTPFLFVFGFFPIVCVLFFFFFGIVLYIVCPSVYSCLFPICAQIYRPLPPGVNPTTLNKYHIPYHKLNNLPGIRQCNRDCQYLNESSNSSRITKTTPLSNISRFDSGDQN